MVLTNREHITTLQPLDKGRARSCAICQTGRQIVLRQLNVRPTLTIRPGFLARVIATRDLVLAPYARGVPP